MSEEKVNEELLGFIRRNNFAGNEAKKIPRKTGGTFIWMG